MKLILLLFSAIALVHCDSFQRTVSLSGNEDLSKVLEDTMPKKCSKNGKEYDVGQEWELGHLRYKCQKYGVYTIEGCVSDKGVKMNVGEKVKEGDVLSQCYKKENSVAFRATVCGILGMPDCDKITQDNDKNLKIFSSATQPKMTMSIGKMRPTRPKTNNYKKKMNLENKKRTTTKKATNVKKPITRQSNLSSGNGRKHELPKSSINDKLSQIAALQAQIEKIQRELHGADHIEKSINKRKIPTKIQTKLNTNSIKTKEAADELDLPIQTITKVSKFRSKDTPLMGGTGDVERKPMTEDYSKLPKAPGLPEGWHILEEHNLKVPAGSSQRAVARTLVFQPEIH